MLNTSSSQNIIEYFELVSYRDADGADAIYGGSIDDTIFGSDGADTLNGSTGNDKIVAGEGDDLVYGDAGNDILLGSYGNDTLDGGAGDDLFLGGAGIDVLIGGDGIDAVNYGDYINGVLVSLETGLTSVGNTLSGIEVVYGTSYDDAIYGSSADNQIYAQGGDDWLVGGAGADYLDGGAGVDRVSYESSGSAVLVDLGAGTASDGDTLTGVEAVYGSHYDDTMIGAGSGDTLYGVNGDDLMIVGDGTTYLYGGDGADTVSFANASSGVMIDLSRGIGGDSVLVDIENASGTDYADTIIGSFRDNRLSGQGGDDTLMGGAGADTFVMEDGWGQDVITDFEDGLDLIDLSGLSQASYDDLTFSQQGEDMLISVGGDSILLMGVSATQISIDDFIF